MKKVVIVLLLIIIALIIGLIAMGPIMSKVEQPEYTVLSTHQNIEIRQYSPMIIAQVTVAGERKEAIQQGFKLLADYIFGNNRGPQEIAMTAPVSQSQKIPMTAPVTQSQNISMTAPVTQQKSHEIPMTAPVTQQAADNQWLIHFVMPSKYSLETLPKPNNKQINIKAIPPKKFAVIRFSGTSTNKNMQTHETELRAFLAKEKIKPLSPASYAFYNPPWTLPFLRRNEVMMEIN